PRVADVTGRVGSKPRKKSPSDRSRHRARRAIDDHQQLNDGACPAGAMITMTALQKPFAFTIDDAVKMAGIGRTSIYSAVSRGELQVRKAGRRTIIMADDLLGWLNKLPTGTRKVARKDA